MGNSKMKAPKLLLVLALLGLVSACADAQNNQKKRLVLFWAPDWVLWRVRK